MPRLTRSMIQAVLGLLLLAGCAPAQPAAVQDKPTTKKIEQPQSTGNQSTGNQSTGDQTAAKKSSGPRVKATNLLELRKHVGKTITAYGRVERIASSSSGHKFVNFAGGQLSAICRKEHVAAFRGGAALDAFRGKDVELTGKLENYKGKMQIAISSADQIRLASAGGGSTGPVLKKVGKNQWMSPAGLRYSGLDPQGKTRVEHIMRHAKDDPKRNGPHGVFAKGEQAQVFALIDEAWKLAEKRKLRPNREGPRSTYSISMGRRIGYLGGSTGRSRGKPDLKRLFIVFETGTKNIITAFPK